MRLSLFCQDICLYPLSPTVNRASMSRIQMHIHFRKSSPFIPRAEDTGLSLRAGLNLQKSMGPVSQWKRRSRWLRIWPSTPEPPRFVFVTHNSGTPSIYVCHRQICTNGCCVLATVSGQSYWTDRGTSHPCTCSDSLISLSGLVQSAQEAWRPRFTVCLVRTCADIDVNIVSAELLQSCPTLCDPMDRIACQAALSMGFFRQESWHEFPCPPSGDLPDPGIKPTSLMSPELAGWLFTIKFSSVSHLCPTLCTPMNHSTPRLPVHQQLLESTQTHVHRVGDATQPSHPLSSPSLPALSLSQHQGLFIWVSSLNQVAKGLEFQLQHQSFQCTPRTDLSLNLLVLSSYCCHIPRVLGNVHSLVVSRVSHG